MQRQIKIIITYYDYMTNNALPFQMLASLFDRCMKRRGVKESDPYDWEKSDLQQVQQAVQQVHIQTSVHQAISGATNNVNNNSALPHNNNNNASNNNLIQTTSLVNPVPSAGVAPLSSINNGAAPLADATKTPVTTNTLPAKPKESLTQGRPLVDSPVGGYRLKMPGSADNNNGDGEEKNQRLVTSSAFSAGAYFAYPGGPAASVEKRDSSATGTMATAIGEATAASVPVNAAEAGGTTTNNTAFHIQNHLRATGSPLVGSAKGPATSSLLNNNNHSDVEKKNQVTVSKDAEGGDAAQKQSSATTEPIVSLKGLTLGTSSGAAPKGQAPAPSAATNKPIDKIERSLASATPAGVSNPVDVPLVKSTDAVQLRANKENRQMSLNNPVQQYQAARATSGMLHGPSEMKKRQLAGSGSGAMTTGRLRVLTAPPISCQDLALEVEKKTSAGASGDALLAHLSNTCKRQLRNSGGSGSRICDEKRNSSSIGGTANNSRVSNSSRDSKLMTLASGERGTGGGGGGDSERVGDHSMTQFALIDDDNVSQQVTRGGGGHTLASQWKSQFDDSEETTDNEWRQEPQSPDICLSRDANVRSSSHQQYSQSGAISKRRSKSGVPGGSSRRDQQMGPQHAMDLRMIVTQDEGGGAILQKSASSHQLQCCVHDETDANNNSGVGRNLVLTNDCRGGGGGFNAGDGEGMILNQMSDVKKEKVKKRLERTRQRSRGASGGQGGGPAVSRIDMGLTQRFINMRQNSQNGAHLYIQGLDNYDHLGMLPPCWSEPALNANHLRGGLEPPYVQQAAFDDHVYHIDVRRNVSMCTAEGQQLNKYETEAKHKSCPDLSSAGLEPKVVFPNVVEVSATVAGVAPKGQEKGKEERPRDVEVEAAAEEEEDEEEEEEDEEEDEEQGAPINGKLEIRVLKSPQPPVQPQSSTTVKIVGEQLKMVPGTADSEEVKKKEHRLSRIPVALPSNVAVAAAAAEVALPDTPLLEDLTPALRRRRRRENTEDKYVKDVDAELNLRFARRSRNLDEEQEAVAGSMMR